MTFDHPELQKFPWATFGRRESSKDFIAKCKEQRERYQLLSNPPKFSILVPVLSHTALDHFSTAVAALRAQAYALHEVVFMGGEGTESHRTLVVTNKNPKLRWVYAKGVTNLVALKNKALEESRGDYVGFVDPEDVLSPAALYHFALEIVQKRAGDILYTNEVHLDPTASKIEACLTKFDSSWFSLIHFNYVRRFWLMKKELVENLGSLSESAGAHAEHEYLLRAFEKKATLTLAPFFHYYRRQNPVLAADESLTKIIEKHLQVKDFAAKVRIQDGRIKIAPELKKNDSDLVSVVICFRNRAEWTVDCVKALSSTKHSVPYEVILVNNQSSSEELAIVKEGVRDLAVNVQWQDFDHPFNYGRMHNLVVQEKARGNYLMLLNNDVTWAQGQDLAELVAWAQWDWVGTVGCSLRYPDGRVQHGGLRALYGGEARLARVGNAQQDDEFTQESREVFGNTFAACMMKKSTYQAVGGLSELEFPNGYGDVAFNFECKKRNLTNLHLGHLQGIHRESASRGPSYEYWEECGLERQYPELLGKMLRQDFGYHRTPGGDYPLGAVLRASTHKTVVEHFPWLLPVKPWLSRAKRLLK